MNLYFKKFGDSPSHLIILHGLLGSSDNWQTIAKNLSGKFSVYVLDARNHGRSPHDNVMTYELMVIDLLHFMLQEKIDKATLIGHSMGGKTAMLFALNYPEKTDKLIVVDIAPKQYDGGHEEILFAMAEAPLQVTQDRKDIDVFLQKRIPDFGIRQFILKNLTRDEYGKLVWRSNVEGIIHAYRGLMGFPNVETVFDGETYFIKGEESDYLLENDEAAIRYLFPNASIIAIPKAGHWVHADQPELFLQTINLLLK
ncbi:MAG TPA: alpha/beta fold hydrolase [Chitinophagales bacterium]|nr:alpha/beta fold hydrolase [Chitinophagales bacterium]HNL85434.1 alpha/beta fold hydrolase [Chitinophagales bacterium]